MKTLAVWLLALSVAACAEYDPIAAPDYDGHYIGTRQSNDSDLCGVDPLRGATSAQVTQGHLSMRLFGPRTQLDGTVGASGRVRASGIWRPPHANYPQVTVLHGSIVDGILEGNASDFRCSTDLRLHKVVDQPRQRPHPNPHRRHPMPVQQ